MHRSQFSPCKNGAPSPPARAQTWLKYAQTKTARHKLAKFLREHAHLLPVPPASPAPPAQPPRAPERSSSGKGPAEAAGEAELPGGQVTWLVVQCSDRPGLLADIALAIADHSHNIKVCCAAQDEEGWNPANAHVGAAAWFAFSPERFNPPGAFFHLKRAPHKIG